MLQLQGALARAELLQERWEVQDEWTRALERREAAGEISGFDVVVLRSATRSLSLARLEARREVLQAQAGLAAAIGVPVAALRRVSLRFNPLEKPPPALPVEQARLRALINRTDILALLAEYEAAQEGLRLEVAKQYPDVQLGPGYEFDQGDNKWTFGISLSLPLFHRNRGPIAEAEARREVAAVRVEEAQARVLSEIDVALADLGSRTAEVVVADSLVDAAVESERRVREYHEAGELSNVDVLAARAETLKAREDGLRVQVAARQAYLDLEDALQSPADWSASFLDGESAAVHETDGGERN
jgi:outer membrane protein TolC